MITVIVYFFELFLPRSPELRASLGGVFSTARAAHGTHNISASEVAPQGPAFRSGISPMQLVVGVEWDCVASGYFRADCPAE